jgi:recombination protein RecT
MSKQITLVGNWTNEDIQTMKETLAVGTNDSQFQLFLRTAHASGLNPFLNHIYAITYQGKMSLQIGIEGIAYLAKQKEGFQGYDAQVVYEHETFKATREKDGTWNIVHEMDGFGPSEPKILGAYAIAYREGFKPYTVIMSFAEVEHFQKSNIPNQQTMWKRYTADMFKKHVLKRALKGQFGIDINEDDAINSDPSVNNVEPYQRKDITEEVTETPAQRSTTPAQTRNEQPKANAPQTQQDAPQAAQDSLEGFRELLSQKFQELGLNQEQSVEFIKANVPNLKQGQKLTVPQIKALIKVIDMEIEQRNELPEELE